LLLSRLEREGNGLSPIFSSYPVALGFDRPGNSKEFVDAFRYVARNPPSIGSTTPLT
jgi:hypothetical protein